MAYEIVYNEITCKLKEKTVIPSIKREPKTLLIKDKFQKQKCLV